MHCPIISGKAARHSAASQKEAEARNFSPARFKRGPFSRQRNAPRRGTMRSGENFPIYALDLSRVDDPAIEDTLLVAGFFLVMLPTLCRKVFTLPACHVDGLRAEV
jgi:hypothetical protein